MSDFYLYEGEIIRVIDGDSFEIEIQLGFSISFRVKTRLWHPDGMIDTPEIRGPEREAGLDSMQYVEAWVEANAPLTIRTHRDKTGKYGRYLVDIIAADGTTLSESLLIRGLAEIKAW
jgi:micrococcal nuclease